jgi:8-oxo-dGTP pyrophosphatase MutT (NUDIX family)
MESSDLNAVGAWFYSVATDRYLYLLRNDTKKDPSWALPGGKCHKKETLLESLQRECREEIGLWPPDARAVPIEKFTSSDDRFCYHTFFCAVPDEFVPILNHEHQGWAWISSGTYPKPLHTGLWNLVNFDEVRQKLETVKSMCHTSQ